MQPRQRVSPVIGDEGVRALYRRSLHLTKAALPRFVEFNNAESLRLSLSGLTGPSETHQDTGDDTVAAGTCESEGIGQCEIDLT